MSILAQLNRRRIALSSSPPIAPTLVIGTITETEITVSWASVPTATLYDLEYKLSSSGTWLEWTDDTSPSTVTGLATATSYDFRVRAFNGVWGEYSTTLVASTIAGWTAFGMWSTGDFKSGNACSRGYPFADAFHDGIAGEPGINDKVSLNVSGSPVFDGGNLWYGTGFSAIRINSSGVVYDSAFCI